MYISEYTVRFYPSTPAGEKMANIYETQARRIGNFKWRKDSTQSICIKTEQGFLLDEELNTVNLVTIKGD